MNGINARRRQRGARVRAINVVAARFPQPSDVELRRGRPRE